MRECEVCGNNTEFEPFEEVVDCNGSHINVQICPCCSVLFNPTIQRQNLSDAQAREFQAAAVQGVYHISDDDIAKIDTRISECIPVLDFLFDQQDIPVRQNIYLEIGAGAGYLAAAATRRFSKVFTTEFDSREIVKTFNAARLKAAQALQSLEEFDSTNEKADCAVLWHTLEHIPRPADFLIAVRQRMERDGVLYFQVPLYRKANIFPAHIWFFNARALKFLRLRTGFGRERIVFDTTNDFMTGIFW